MLLSMQHNAGAYVRALMACGATRIVLAMPCITIVPLSCATKSVRGPHQHHKAAMGAQATQWQ